MSSNADNEKEQMPYRSMIKNHDKQALQTWRRLHASIKTHQGKIHMKTNMKKNLSELATVMIKTSISQLIHKINENKIKGFSHQNVHVHKESKKMHVSTFIILDMFGSLVYLLSMTNRPKKINNRTKQKSVYKQYLNTLKL